MTHAIKKLAPPMLSLLIALTAAPLAAQDAATGAIEVEIPDLRSAKGSVRCGLFATAKGFPDVPPSRSVVVTVRAKQATCAFKDVPAGQYAVSLFHDEDNDGELDKNFLGVPQESYGVSNNKTYAMSAPKYNESAFKLAAGETKRLTIKLRH
jgi:uncharacterized protein (DUF2141 family)